MIHLSPIKEKVLELLTNSPGQRFERARGAIEHLATQNEWKETSVAQALVDLAKIGLIEKERRGRRVFYFFEDAPTSLTEEIVGVPPHKRTIIYFKDIDGQITAAVPSLPGCSTKGSTLEEAGRKIRDMAQGYLASSRHNSGDIPQELATETVSISEQGTV